VIGSRLSGVQTPLADISEYLVCGLMIDDAGGAAISTCVRSKRCRACAIRGSGVSLLLREPHGNVRALRSAVVSLRSVLPQLSFTPTAGMRALNERLLRAARAELSLARQVVLTSSHKRRLHIAELKTRQAADERKADAALSVGSDRGCRLLG
jgi:hypothetical protein